MQHKIVFTGQVGAGKTTAIATISDIEVVHSEASTDDIEASHKETTTVAMDYGILNLEDGTKIHLYGTPGQKRFSYMWDILTVGGIGLVILIDNNKEDPIADLEFYLKAFHKFIKTTGVVIGITRMDVNPIPRLNQYQEKLNEMGLKVPLFEVDARKENDVKTLLLSLLYSLKR